MTSTVPQQPLHPLPPNQQSHLSDTDPLVKYQILLPLLKESASNFIKHTVFILQNTPNGQCKQSEIQMMNKCMEDFYNISDQVHQWLILADSTVSQYQMGVKFSTKVYPSFDNNPQQQQQHANTQDVLFYTQYLSNAKRQVDATGKLREMLIDFVDDLGNG